MSDVTALIEEARAVGRAGGHHPYVTLIRRLADALAAAHTEAEHLHEEDAREAAALRQERDSLRLDLANALGKTHELADYWRGRYNTARKRAKQAEQSRDEALAKLDAVHTWANDYNDCPEDWPMTYAHGVDDAAATVRRILRGEAEG